MDAPRESGKYVYSPMKKFEVRDEDVSLHKNVVQRVMEEYGVILVAYGMSFKNKKTPLVAMSAGYQAMKQAMKVVEDKVELGVKVLSDRDALPGDGNWAYAYLAWTCCGRSSASWTWPSRSYTTLKRYGTPSRRTGCCSSSASWRGRRTRRRRPLFAGNWRSRNELRRCA